VIFSREGDAERSEAGGEYMLPERGKAFSAVRRRRKGVSSCDKENEQRKILYVLIFRRY